MKLLADTHVLFWWLQGDKKLSTAQKKAIDRTIKKQPLLVSDISLWEIATLYELGRIRIPLPLREFLERAVSPPLVERVGLSPAIVAQVAMLPTTFHRDPADRILVATALVHGCTILSCDARIAEAKLVPVI